MKDRIIILAFLALFLWASFGFTVQKTAGSWGFVAANAKGERWIFGPWATELECMKARNSEALKDKWIVVTDCGDYGLSKDCRSGCKQTSPSR